MNSLKLSILVFTSSLLIIIEAIFSQTSIYVYSPKNILPDENLKVQVSASNALSQKIYFEVYRIPSPQKFIERKVDVLNFTKEQFESLSREIELEFKTERYVKIYQYWFSDSFDLGKISKPGTYLVKLQIDTATAFSFTTCSSFGLISKRTIDEALIYVSNRVTSKPISNLSVSLISIDHKIFTGKTDKNGIVNFKIGDRAEDRRLFIIIHEKDNSYLMQDVIYSPSYDYQKFMVYTYTNQPVYRPNQKVYFKSIIRERIHDELISYANKPVKIKIVTPENETCYRSEFQTNINGTIHGEYELLEQATLGEYIIYIEVENEIHTQSFFVEEYKKPEFKLTIKTVKENYSFDDTLEIKINAEYYFGQVLPKGNVKIEISRKPIVRHWWEFEPFSAIYRGCFIDIIPFYEPELIHIAEGEIVNGEFKYIYRPNLKDEKNYEYIITATCSDESNRQISAMKKVFVTFSDLVLTTAPSKYFYLPGQKITIKVYTTDFSKNPISKDFEIIIQKIHFVNQHEYYEDIDTLKGKTLNDGIGFVHFKAKDEGKYSYFVKIRHKDKIIIQRNNFIVGKDGIFPISIGEGLQIIPSKDVYNENEDIEFLLISPINDVNIFITLEQSRIYYFKLHELKGNTQYIRIPQFNLMTSQIHISAGFYFDNIFYSSLKRIALFSEKNNLKVNIIPSKERYKPQEKGKFKITVTDFNNKPVENAELLTSIIDESIFAIKGELPQNIFNFFNLSTIYKVFSGSTELVGIQNYAQIKSGMSSHLQNEKKILLYGSSGISGLIIDEQTNVSLENVEVKLISKKGTASTRTDSKGYFIFKNIPAGKYDLFISTVNYLNKTIKNLFVRNRTIKNLGSITIQKIDYYAHPRKAEVLYSRLDLRGTEEVEPIRSLSQTAIETLPESFVRKEFKDALYWNPLISTDKNGEATVELTFPDNLTTWRNSIKTIYGNNQFGESIANVITTKDLILRLEHPRYLHEKDEAVIIANIHNYYKDDKQITFSVMTDDAEILDLTSSNDLAQHELINNMELKIKSNSSAKVKIKIKPKEKVKEIKILAYAFVKGELEESDALEIKIPVEPSGIPEVNVYNINLFASRTSYNQKINLHKNFENAQIEIAISPSLLNPILTSIEELVGYPYGCVEQTMSRFLPTIMVANLIQELNVKINSKTLDELPKMVGAGVNRLKELQHADGGWGWWTNDQTNPYMTAYVVYGLSLTKKAGYFVPQTVLSRGVENLKFQIQKVTFLDERTLAYMLYALSEYYDISENQESELEIIKSYFNRLLNYDKDPYIYALLLQIANKFSLTEYIPAIQKSLIQLAYNVGNITYWGDRQEFNRLISDRIEITAQAIKGLVQSNLEDKIIENGIRWLMNSRKGNYWISTKQTASVIFALTDYLKRVSELNPDYSVRILINGKEFKSFKFDAANVSFTEIKIKVPLTLLKAGINEIKFEKNGVGSFYSMVIVKTFLNNEIVDKGNFEVERKYYRIIQIKENEKYINKLEEIKDSVKAGEKILVRLSVKNNFDLEYFMLEDPKVPGFEIIDDLNIVHIQRDYSLSLAHKENRDRKYSFFSTNFNRGELNFSYLAYAQLPGKYYVNPAFASLMYYPDVNGYTKFQKLVIYE